MLLCPNITVKKVQTAFLRPLIADLLCESNAEEINYLISSGLSCHLKVTRDHWVQPCLLRGRGILALATSHTRMD